MRQLIVRACTGMAAATRRRILLPKEALCDSCRDRHLKLFALIGFYHEEDPENESNQADQAIQRGREPETAEPSQHETGPETEKDTSYNADHKQPAENDHGLRGMKPHVRPLVDQEKDDPRDPAEDVAQQSRNVFGHARVCALRSLHHLPSRLRLPAVRAKRDASRYFNATLAAKGHRMPPS